MTEEKNPGNLPAANPVPSEKRKVSKSETGHAINLANLIKLIAICLGFGADYNPGNSSITLAALTAKQTAASAVLTLLNNLVALHIIAKDKRAIAFKPFSRLLLRILYAVKASNVSGEFINDVKTIIRKLQGRRAKAKEKIQENIPLVPETEVHNYKSISQLSFDSRLENFHMLIQLLQTNPIMFPTKPT